MPTLWRGRDLNPQPCACKAPALPLRHNPIVLTVAETAMPLRGFRLERSRTPFTAKTVSDPMCSCNYAPSRGDTGLRSPDILNAIQVLCQLSYVPKGVQAGTLIVPLNAPRHFGLRYLPWLQEETIPRPSAFQTDALPTELHNHALAY